MVLIFPIAEWEHFLYVGKVAFVGWCLHYLPFLIMGRVTYIHHYVRPSQFMSNATYLPNTDNPIPLPTVADALLLRDHVRAPP